MLQRPSSYCVKIRYRQQDFKEMPVFILWHTGQVKIQEFDEAADPSQCECGLSALFDLSMLRI